MATQSPTRSARQRKDEPGAALVVASSEVVQGEVVDASPALEVEARIKEALAEGKSALWKASEAMWEFEQIQGWASLGYTSLNKWLEDPEIDMTRGTYYRLVRTWQKLAIEKGIERPQLEQVSMSKAALVADEVASGKVRPATALKDVQQLTAEQLREKYDKPKRGRPAKTEQRDQHSPGTAMRAAAELPWDFVEQALHGRAPLQLREARLKEALQQFLNWRDTFVSN